MAIRKGKPVVLDDKTQIIDFAHPGCCPSDETPRAAVAASPGPASRSA
jgi:hypothetical protein